MQEGSNTINNESGTENIFHPMTWMPPKLAMLPAKTVIGTRKGYDEVGLSTSPQPSAPEEERSKILWITDNPRFLTFSIIVSKSMEQLGWHTKTILLTWLNWILTFVSNVFHMIRKWVGHYTSLKQYKPIGWLGCWSLIHHSLWFLSSSAVKKVVSEVDF